MRGDTVRRDLIFSIYHGRRGRGPGAKSTALKVSRQAVPARPSGEGRALGSGL